MSGTAKIVGMVNGVDTNGFRYVKFAPVLASILSNPSPVGDNFVVTNNERTTTGQQSKPRWPAAMVRYPGKQLRWKSTRRG